MKKIIAILVALMVVSLTMMAQGEVRVKSFSTFRHYDELTSGYVVDHCYVLMTTDYGDETIRLEVSEDEYNELYAQWRSDNEATEKSYNNRWYVKAQKWVFNAATDVKDFVVFWD